LGRTTVAVHTVTGCAGRTLAGIDWMMLPPGSAI
jgi:hypothetical protein